MAITGFNEMKNKPDGKAGMASPVIDAKGKFQELASSETQKVEEVASDVTQKAQDWAANVADKAQEPATAAVDRADDRIAASYVYQPTNAVTASFSRGQDLKGLQRELSDAGFKEERINVFEGEQGAAQLDLKGENHGAWVKFRLALEHAFADEDKVHQGTDELLRSGGSLVVAFTDGDGAKKERAISIFRRHQSQEVLYWGEWALERF